MRQRLVLAVVAVLAVVGAALAVARPWSDEVPDGTAFRVGDRAVTVDELHARNDSLRAMYGIQEPLDGKELDAFRRQAAKSMAISIVLDRAVAEAGIDVPDAEVDAAVTSFVGNRFDGDRDQFLDALGNVNTSEDAVRTEVRRQLELRELLDEVAGDVVISDADVRSAFAQRRASLATPERRVVSNLVVSSEAEARQVRRRLDRGADVAVLARQVSIDAATRDKGGRLGAVARADLLPAVAEAVFAAPVGRAYGPVEGSQGWNVGVVTAVRAPVAATLAGSAATLRTALTSEEEQAAWSDWLAGELRAADVTYEASYRPSDPYDVSAWEEQP